jgi:phage-related protein
VRTINFYRTESGICPVEEFLDSLSGKQAQKVLWVLRLIEELDSVPKQYFQKLVNTEDIWEVRVQFGGDIFRLLGFFAGSSLLILTNSFAKKSQKTPRQEIDRAIRRKNEYLSQQRKK